MTKAETLELLRQIADGYPQFMKDRDPERTADIWQQCLEYEEASDLKCAFIQYMRNDTRNIPPAPGSLLQYVDRNKQFDDEFEFVLPTE